MTLSKAEQAVLDCPTCTAKYAVDMRGFVLKAAILAYQKDLSTKYVHRLYAGVYHLTGHNDRILDLFDIAARQE
jgi:hypothetical protein